MNDLDFMAASELDEGLLDAASGFEDSGHQLSKLDRVGTVQRTGTAYTTAMSVQKPRDLQLKAKQLLAEAKMAGESFYYGWGSGENRVIGPSIGLAMAAARVWGNCAVQPLDVQETEDSWYMPVVFVDLETGFTLGRTLRQSKTWTISGRYDAERKDDMRFQIGQSKAARNVVCNALPRWLIDSAVRAAQEGVRERIVAFVQREGLARAVDIVVDALAKQGVPLEAILEKCKVASKSALSIDHVVMLRGDLYALQEGQDRPESLFESLSKAGKKSGRRDKARSPLDDALAGGPAESGPAETGTTAEEPPSDAPPKAKRKRRRKAKAEPAEPATSDAGGTDATAGEESQSATEPGTAPDGPASGGQSSTGAEGSAPAAADEAADLLDEVEYPPGFIAALKACKSISDVDKLGVDVESRCHTVEVWEAVQLRLDARRDAIRNAYRSV